jgi:APA family basic amino acid/polyamine antiporter
MGLSRLLIKKSVARIQQEGATSELKRTLGKWNLLSLGIGCIIGAGIFVLTGTAAANHAGPAIVLSFVLAGLACAFAGLCYAEMASVLPVSGSAYTYAYATLGEIFAWIMGWLLILEYGLASSTVAVGWSGYIVSFLRDFGVFIPPEYIAAYDTAVFIPESARAFYEAYGYSFNEAGELLNAAGNLVMGVFNAPAAVGIAMVTSLLVIGVSESAKVNNIIVAVKVSVIIAFIAIGVFYVDTANWSPFIPENTGPGEFGVDGILRAASIIFFAYIGFESISTAAAEAKNPQKDMPFGIIGALIVCTALYILVSFVLTGVTHYSNLNVADPMAVAVDAIGLGWFSFIIKIGAITGLSSVMLVLVYGQTRIFYTMSRDGLLPDLFCKVHPKFHTPYINTILVGVVVAFAAGMTPISVLGDLVSLGTLSAFTIVSISVLYLRWKEPDLERPFKVPFAPVTPLLGIACCGYLIAQMPLEIFIKLKFFFLAGLVVYAVYGFRKSRLAREMRPRAGDAGFVAEEHEARTE